jgi:hypothetical protein
VVLEGWLRRCTVWFVISAMKGCIPMSLYHFGRAVAAILNVMKDP